MRNPPDTLRLGMTILFLACGRAPHQAATPQVEPPRIVGYLASWGVRSKGTRIADLPGHELTHIIYSFAQVSADGRLALGDPCLDIDWEYPVRGGLPTNTTRPEDRVNCTLLLKALRAELDAQGARDGHRYLL